MVAGAVCIAGGHVSYPAAVYSIPWSEAGLGNGTFLKETSLSPVAKGGMSHESDGAPHASHGHSQLAGVDRGRDTLDHRGRGKISPEK